MPHYLRISSASHTHVTHGHMGYHGLQNSVLKPQGSALCKQTAMSHMRNNANTDTNMHATAMIVVSMLLVTICDHVHGIWGGGM